jgi:hypothetical protein
MAKQPLSAKATITAEMLLVCLRHQGFDPILKSFYAICKLGTRMVYYGCVKSGESERSPDRPTRNPGLTARLTPDFVSLNPGYAC